MTLRPLLTVVLLTAAAHGDARRECHLQKPAMKVVDLGCRIAKAACIATP